MAEGCRNFKDAFRGCEGYVGALDLGWLGFGVQGLKFRVQGLKV